MIAQASAAATLAGFVLTAAAVVYAGTRLARHGDVIAARTRWGRLWVGSLFLAIATSLPELTTDVAAIRLGAVDLAAGDIFGSSMANMLILALLSLIPGTELFRRAALDNGLAASLAIALTATAALAVMIRSTGSILGVGYGSLVLGAGYVIGMRAVYRNTALVKRAVEIEETAPPGSPSLRSALMGFLLATLLVLIAAAQKPSTRLTGAVSSYDQQLGQSGPNQAPHQTGVAKPAAAGLS
jgi:cation:H+ antiporter